MNFYDEKNLLVRSALSERDGYFSYMGLAPGKYTVMPDPRQLEQLGYQSSARTVTIVPNAEGDYIDNLEFILHKSGEGPVNSEKPPIEDSVLAKDAVIHTRKFTLGETNPALLELLKNKTLEEQKQIMESLRLGLVPGLDHATITPCQ